MDNVKGKLDTETLLGRGWTPELIAKLLGEADASGYAEERVAVGERTPQFCSEQIMRSERARDARRRAGVKW